MPADHDHTPFGWPSLLEGYQPDRGRADRASADRVPGRRAEHRPARERRCTGSTSTTAGRRSRATRCSSSSRSTRSTSPTRRSPARCSHGELDGEGFPRFDAIVGGPVSYWDETSGRADRAHRARLGRRGRHAATRSEPPSDCCRACSATCWPARAPPSSAASSDRWPLSGPAKPVSALRIPGYGPTRALLPQVRHAHGEADRCPSTTTNAATAATSSK